jgi:hypothetical protein
MIRFLAAVIGCLLFVAPAVAQGCMKWEDGVHVAARYSHDNGDRVAAVLLTPEETKAVWAILRGPGDDGPVRLGVMVSQSQPEVAFVAGFDAAGCLIGSGSMAFGPVLDAMVSADVKSEFVIIEPVPPEAGA